jgi:beta-phosphoglucomutase family hydrolase
MSAAPLDSYEAVIFDLDGVITRTASIHAAAWKAAFDEYLSARAATRAEPFHPFDLEHDYQRYVDGKPRYEGARSFLGSRGIELPWGTPEDPPGRETVCGLGNRKEQRFLALLAQRGVEVYPSSLAWLRALRARGRKTAVVSSSRHCEAILEAAGLTGLFEVRIDGVEIARLGLPGKPAPDSFLEAARRLGVPPRRAVVVEDAIAGVEAGRRGGFGLVLGVDRGGNAQALQDAGADRVVADLSELWAAPWVYEQEHPAEPS